MLNSLTAPVAAGPLALTRMLIGVAALIKGATFLPRLLSLSHPDALVVPVFDWMPHPDRALLIVISIAWLAAAGLFMLGWRVGISGSALALAVAFTLVLDHQTYSNHLYLLAWMTVLTTLADAGASHAFPRSDEERPVPFWGPLLIMTQVSVVYFFAALTKLTESFLSGQVVIDSITGGLIDPPAFLTTSAAGRSLAMLTITAELFLAFGLWFRVTRLPAVLVGLGLHGSIVILMGPLSELAVFGLLMLAAYPLFLRTLPAARSAPADGLQEPGQGLLEAGS